VLDDPAHATRHELSFLTSRIKKYHRVDLAEKIAHSAEHFYHAADLLAPVFLKMGLWRDLISWGSEMLRSAELPWIRASFIRMFPRNERLPGTLVRSFAEIACDPTTPGLVRVAAVSRVAKWRPSFARDVFAQLSQSDADPVTRRGVAIAGTVAGVPPRSIRRFLLEDNATVPVAEFLSHIDHDGGELRLKV
jgi:hypothetical protein